MKMIKFSKLPFKIVFTSLILSLVACQPKKREDNFAQGEGKDLEKISDYDGKTFKVKTLHPLAGKMPNITAADKGRINTELNNSPISVYPYVHYETTSPLFKEIPFKGKPHTTDVYELRYEVTPKYLIIYKVADPSMIPSDEQTYAKKRSDSKIEVPMVGYPITSFINVNHAKNNDGEKTHTLREFSERDKHSSKYFKFDVNEKTLFNAVTKVDLLPRSYFDGEWYFAATVVKSHRYLNNNNLEGDQLIQNVDRFLTSKIKFIFDSENLRAVSLHRSHSTDKNDSTRLTNVISLKSALLDYKSLLNTGENKLKEEINNDTHKDSRPFVQLSFDSINLSEDTINGSLEDITLLNNYFSFLINSQDLNLKIRFSFLKVKKSDYQARVYPLPDHKKFGFFSVDLLDDTNPNLITPRRKDTELQYLLKRFNPNKNIVYHFSTNTPRCTETDIFCFRKIAKKAIEEWNRGFSAAGAKSQILLDESFDVELGDIRYNVLNYYDNPNTFTTYSGYGPSIADSETGEIISATANLFNLKLLNLSIESQVYEANRNIQPSNLISIKSNKLSTSLQSQRSDNTPMASNHDNSKNELLKQSTRNNLHEHSKMGEELLVHSKQLSNTLSEKCPEISSLISHDPLFEIEDAKIKNCALTVLNEYYFSITLHELGHNFGLRHNFAASADIENYSTFERTKILSSSVMDYHSMHNYNQIFIGLYDIAAIQYGYADQITTTHNKILNLIPKKSISSLEAESKTSARKYRFCGDDDLHVIKNDPFCLAYDRGSLPIDISKNEIADFKNDLNRFLYRKGRLSSSTTLPNYFSSTFSNLKNFYDHWRVAVRSKVGIQNENLSFINEKDYLALIEKHKSDSDFKYAYEYYRPTADLIFEFLTGIIFMPPQSCLVQDSSTNKIKLIYLEDILNHNRSLKLKQFTCAEEDIQKYLTSQKYSYLGEIGYPHQDQFLDQANYPSRLDATGFDAIKRLALDALFSNSAIAKYIQDSLFFPAILDEPHYFNKWIQLLKHRILKGHDPQLILKLAKEKNIQLNQAQLDLDSLKKFELERETLTALAASIYDLNRVPGSKQQKNKRFVDFGGFRPSSTASYAQTFYFVPLTSGDRYVANPNTHAADFVNQYNSIRDALECLNQPDPMQDIRSFSSLQDNIPSITDDNNYTIYQLYALMETSALILNESSRPCTNLVARTHLAYSANKLNEFVNDVSNKHSAELYNLIDSSVRLRFPHPNLVLMNRDTNFVDNSAKKIANYLDLHYKNELRFKDDPNWVFSKEGINRLLKSIPQSIEALPQIIDFKKFENEYRAQHEILYNMFFSAPYY